MAKKTTKGIEKIVEMMRDLDFCMLTTHTGDGQLHARPMSNNREVEFDGDVWFFSAADSRKVEEIQADSEVELSFADIQKFRFISMSGTAEIVTDTKKKEDLWIEDLERWFEGGPDSEEIVLIKVTPSTIEYWDGEDGGVYNA